MRHDIKIDIETLKKIDGMVNKWLDRLADIAELMTPWKGISIFKKRKKK